MLLLLATVSLHFGNKKPKHTHPVSWMPRYKKVTTASRESLLQPPGGSQVQRRTNEADWQMVVGL
jgi:hypothetical protein